METTHPTKDYVARIAALGDLHVKPSDGGRWRAVFAEAAREADVLVLCGDLTHHGTEQEAAVLAGELAGCDIPVVGVLGNHDHGGGCPGRICRRLATAGVRVLDGDCVVAGGVGFAGAKGFAGGFDLFGLNPFGEQAFHAFVAEAVREVGLLDSALEQLEQLALEVPRLVVMHYAPVAATVLGEPEPLYPFLGSSRLSEPLEPHGLRAAFHGHAHGGTLAGHAGGVAVFNVAYPVLVRQQPPRPFFLYTV